MFSCPICGSDLEELSACGSVAYFCNRCNQQVSKQKIIKKIQVQEVSQPNVEEQG